MLKTPVIFDCDPGHDDAIALILALASEALDVKAVTCVAGNASVENTTKNALKVLELCGFNHIPVAKGASKPILIDSHPGKNVHGESGMDGPVLPEPTTTPSPLSACDLIASVLEESPVPVALIVTGPCTNIATFLLSYPHLKKKIDCISIMGGGFLFGNRSAVAEFNIWQDPEAGQIVMQSGIPIELYGLDVTHKAQIYKDEFIQFRNQDNEISSFVAELLDFFSIYYTGFAGQPGCPMHDACAVAGLIEPRLFSYEQSYMEVDLVGRFTRGGVAVDLRTEPRRQYPYNGKIALDVDRPQFLKLLLDSCQTLASRKEASR